MKSAVLHYLYNCLPGDLWFLWDSPFILVLWRAFLRYSWELYTPVLLHMANCIPSDVYGELGFASYTKQPVAWQELLQKSNTNLKKKERERERKRKKNLFALGPLNSLEEWKFSNMFIVTVSQLASNLMTLSWGRMFG